MPFLGIEIRDINDRAVGKVRLPISNVAPGETKIVEADCYKAILNPQHVRAYIMPDPTPETHGYYWEFKPLRNCDPAC